MKPGHKFDIDSVKIIDSENNEKMRKVVEAILIGTHQHGFNRQSGYDLLSIYAQLLQGGVGGNSPKMGQPS